MGGVNSGCRPLRLKSSPRYDLGRWFRSASFSVVLTRRITRTRLTLREFVIATGHHSRSRTIARKSLILGPGREVRSKIGDRWGATSLVQYSHGERAAESG